MKIALIGDTHAGARGDSPLFNEYFFKFWENIFFPYLKENDIKHIVHLGDVVDRRKFINFVTLNSWRKRFFDVLEREGITMDVIVGNHDVTYKNTNEINAIHELFERYENINVHIDPVQKQYDDLSVLLVPWINSSNYQNALDALKNTTSEVVFGHFEIAGFEMDRGNVCHTGMEKSVFSRFDMVLSGHFHHKSSDGTIYYLGNQYEMTWSDYNDQRGFHILDTSNRELTFVPNTYKIFQKIYYDDTASDFETWKQYDFSQHKDCFVKIVAVKKNNYYLFDYVVDNLYKHSAADISIVDDFSELKVEDDDEIISQAEDTMTILSKYIDGLTLDVNHDKLKGLMRELYIESLNVEVSE